MKNVISFLFVALFCFSSAVAAEDIHKPQLYDYHGTPVDPLCFLNNIGTEDAPIYPTRFCQYEEIVNVGQSGIDENKFVAVSYEESYYDPETEESFSSFGFIGYRAIGMVKGDDGNEYMALVLVENGGGSGTFSSIMLVDPVRDEAEKTLNFHHIETLSVGDRCMGGYKDAWVEDGELYFRVHTTMIDMLGLVGEPDREILRSEAARWLPGCASCCYAEVEYSTEEFRGVFFPKDRMKPDENNSEAARCIDELVDLNVTQAKQDYFGAEDFGFFVRELEHVCLGRVEGQE